MRYRDEDSASVSSRGSSRRSSTAPSYVDRFRPDAAYQQPTHSSAAPQGPASIPQLLSLIKRAVRPTLQQPDLALNLQIADMINEKKGSAPREAAMAIVGYINQSSSTSILALSVLDVCVKNCGYPFHLQISRKDFLNNLVKRFPEKPPLRYSHSQTLILEAIQEWRETICRNSKHKSDFGFIRDMHRLLQYKGYVFPQVNREDAAVLNAPEQLKSAAELEQEDRDAQSAKLHELLRTGAPSDLEEANRIMKLLAGFKEQSTDYRQEVARKLDEARQKGEILEEMLNTFQEGDTIDQNDVFGELASSLQSILPQIRKIKDGEQEEDPDAADKCAALYNYLEALVQKYRFLVQGNVQGANAVPISSLSSGNYAGAPKKSLIESLIDFDEVGGTPSASTPTGGATGSNDLLGLDFGGLSLGGGFETPVASASAVPSTPSVDLFGDVPAASSPAPSAAPSGLDFLDSTAPATPVGPSTPESYVVAHEDATVALKFGVSRKSGNTVVTAYISNPSQKRISNLVLEVAGTKGRPVSLGAASGTQLDSPLDHITQTCSFPGSQPVKFRWRLAFKSGISDVVQSGTQQDL